MREKHVGELEEDIKDINDQLLFKEKRREQAELFRNYKLCDQLKEMSSLKKQKRERKEELALWKRKQQQSRWYCDRKKSWLSVSTSGSDDEQHSGSSTTLIAPSTPQSSRATSPYLFISSPSFSKTR